MAGRSQHWSRILEARNVGKCNVNADIFGRQRLTIFSAVTAVDHAGINQMAYDSDCCPKKLSHGSRRSNPGKCNVNAGIFGQQRLTIFSNNGTGCPKCAWKITLTHEEAVERLNSKHAGRIIPLENYVNTTMPWKVQCKCGHIWAPKANSLFTGCGCPKCAAKSNGEKSKLSHEEAVARLAEIHKGKITALEPYPGNDNPWKVQCACGHTWAPLPYILFGGHGCLKCGIKSTHEKQQLSADQANARL